MSDMPPAPQPGPPTGSAPPAAPSAPVETQPVSAGLKALAVVMGVLAAVAGVGGQVERNRTLGITEYPDPPLALGAAVGSIIIPLVVGLLVARFASRRAGFITFAAIAAVIALLGLVQILDTWG